MKIDMLGKRHRELSALSDFLIKTFEGNTTILFGSRARNEDEEFSDIDLLLITDWSHSQKRAHDIREMYSKIPRHLMPEGRPLKLAAYSKNDFRDAYHKGSLFIAHVIKEGVLLHDDGFYSRLTEKDFELSREDLKLSLAILKQRLSITDDLTKFNNFFMRCLAEFFAISKNMVYIALALKGRLVFDKKKAFAEFADIYPSYEEKTSQLYLLYPFFLRNVKGIKAPLPFQPYDCEDKIVELRESIRGLMAKVAEDDN